MQTTGVCQAIKIEASASTRTPVWIDQAGDVFPDERI
jgi:hypothetical protein